MSHYLSFESGSPIQVYVDSIPKWEQRPVIVEHHILDTTHSTLQYIGAESPKLELRFMLYGRANMGYVEACVNSGSPMNYIDDDGTTNSYFVVDNLNSDRQQALNYTDHWYRCSISATRLTASGSLYYQW